MLAAVRFGALYVLCCTVLVIGAPNVNGTWTGTIDFRLPEGGLVSSHLFIQFEQTGDAVFGTAGPSEHKQSQITNGKITGDIITFKVGPAGHVFEFALAPRGRELHGRAEADDGTTAIVRLKRER